MSFYEESSIVITPNAYKAGTLYAINPASGLADMDVTRATAATRVDENGLVNYAEIIGGEEVTCGDFSCAVPTDYWTATNAIISFSNNEVTVDDTAGAGADSRAAQNFPTIPGKSYIVKFNRVSTTSQFWLGIGDGLAYSNIFYSALGTTTGEYTVQFTATGTSSTIALITSASGITVYSNVSVKQVDRDNVPRIDYTGGGCPHILAEPQRTNLLTQSNQFDTTWVQSGTLTSGQDGVGGSTDAWKFQNPNSTSSLYQPDTTSGVQTLSAYFKKNSNYGVRFYAFGSINCSAFFDLNNGAVVVEFNSTAKIETVGDDWFRCSMTFDQTNTRCDFYVTNNASTQVLGDYTIQYAQLEEGSYPTSYIPTSGATVTRNQDQFSRDGISSLINSTEGCVFGEGNFAESNSSSYNYFVSLSDGTSSNRLEVRQSSPNLQFLWRVATYQSEISTSSLDVSSNFKFALNYSAANIKFYVNGDLIGTINTPTLWSVNTLNRLAFDDGTGGNRLSGKVKQLQVYPTALTDEQLIELTGVTYSSYLAMANALNYTIQ